MGYTEAVKLGVRFMPQELISQPKSSTKSTASYREQRVYNHKTPMSLCLRQHRSQSWYIGAMYRLTPDFDETTRPPTLWLWISSYHQLRLSNLLDVRRQIAKDQRRGIVVGQKQGRGSLARCLSGKVFGGAPVGTLGPTGSLLALTEVSNWTYYVVDIKKEAANYSQ